MKCIIDKLRKQQRLAPEEYRALLTMHDPQDVDYLMTQAREVAQQQFGKGIYLRGLIELTNVCRNDCLYCGIRRSNPDVARYRLTAEEILACAAEGYDLGFRTFVLQGGEDSYYKDETLCAIVSGIKARFPDCAVTLSMGERSRESYQRLFDAGAERYLLRHETADGDHYARLHPPEMSYENRMRCLRDLREIGYQVGCGFMVGSPYQTPEILAKDLKFIETFRPEMCGIGPFIPHHGTPFRNEKAGALAGGDAAAPVRHTAHPSPGAAARHHRAGHHPSPGAGAGHTGRGQCGDAEPVPCGRAQTI